MSKVVPFERSVAYLHRRAALNRREGRLLDALGLIRRAVEREPEDLAYQMDLAETLCEMGCYVQSNRVLAGMLARKDAPEDCYFGLCCNYFGMNELDAAYHALIRFLARDPAAAERPEVNDMLKNIVLVRALGEIVDRRAMRARRLERKAMARLREGREVLAERLLRESLRLCPGQASARALLAEALLGQGKAAEARREAEEAIRAQRKEPDIRSLCVAARACLREGDGQAARGFLDQACALECDGQDVLMVLGALCEAGDNERVRAHLSRVLRAAPYDRVLLHACAVNRIRLGEPAQQAISFWTRMLRVDPEDDVALYCAERAANGTLEQNMPYGLWLPEGERARRREALIRATALPDEVLRARWSESAALPDLCRWALRSEDRSAGLFARTLLARVEDERAAMLRQESLVDPNQPFGGRDMHLRWGRNGGGASIVAIEENMGEARLPLKYRKAMKLAARAAFKKKGDLSARIARIQMTYMTWARRMPPLRDAREWAAALLFAAVWEEDKAFTPEDAARLLDCSRRAAWRCVTRLTEALSKGVRDADEDH